MPLNLHERRDVQTVFNAGVSIDDLTWWFWIKGGIGFTIGVALVSIVAGVLTWGAILLAGLLLFLAHR